MLLPLRYRILVELYRNGSQDAKTIMSALADEYGKDRQFSLKRIKYHLQSLRAVGLVEDVSVELDEHEEMIRIMGITDSGKDYMKYLPKEWKQALLPSGQI